MAAPPLTRTPTRLAAPTAATVVTGTEMASAHGLAATAHHAGQHAAQRHAAEGAAQAAAPAAHAATQPAHATAQAALAHRLAEQAAEHLAQQGIVVHRKLLVVRSLQRRSARPRAV